MAECIADVDCSLEMAKDRLLAEMAKGITPTNQLNGPQNRAEFHAGMYMWSERHRESGIFRVKICLLNPRCIFVYPRRIT